ncbi:hypothetical protein Adt_18189 [Abeliophyllum distichum]|uniref:Uncharacterized protein n=1 Tax=Abeliophyllum distichum TaxID=126358 RepID=A0ABD1TIN6_9LAMI
MSSIFQSFRGKQALPVSQPEEEGPSGIRRRLSSLSLDLNFQPNISSPAASWAFRRSKSVSSMGEYAGNSIRKWWDWGWTWILSRKPIFAKDLEMNEEETTVIGCHNKGSLGHVFYKVRSEFRKLIRSNNVGLPQTFRYDSNNYKKNFDNGSRSTILAH